MRTLLLVSVTFLFVSAVFGQDLLPVKEGKLYGFSRDGKMIIAPKYSYATHFRDGLALVQNDGKWGYIDPSGAWIVPATYDAAQPMVDGKALIFMGGKMGLVNSKGKVLLQPIYDKIEEGWGEGYIYKDSLVGLCDSSWNILIEPNYARITSWTEGFNCQRTDGSWDVYARGKKIAEGLTRPAYSDYIYNTKNIILEQNGKVGIFDLDKGWLVKAEYDTIYKQDFYEHKLGDQSYRFLYILDRDKSMEIEGWKAEKYNGELFRVAFADGRLVSDRYYTWVYAEPWGDYQADTVMGFRLHHPNGITYLSPSLRKIDLPYYKVERHLDWYIATTREGKAHILRPDFSILASYATVRVNSRPADIDPETGLFLGDDIFDEYAYFLLVAKEALDRPVEAVYFLKEEREVSPFIKEIIVTPQMEGSTDTDGYIYTGSEVNGRGFFFPGMSNGTAPIYQDVTFFAGKRVIVTKDGKRVLYQIKDGQLKPIVTEKEVLHNFELVDGTFDPEGNQFLGVQPEFQNHFWVPRNEAGKLGIVANNNKVFACQYDSIIQNLSAVDFVDAYANGKYTTINIQTGEQIYGSYDRPLTLVYNDDYNYHYAYIEQSENSYYVDSRGKFYSTSGEVYPFKKDGKVGAEAYNEVNQTEDKVVVIPAVYKSLQRARTYESYFEAKNTEGLLGVLSPRGDTVIPFLYKELKPIYLHFNEEDVYQTKSKDGLGLANVYQGVIVPAIFDSWEEYYTPEHIPFAIMTRKGEKRGLYSYDGEELLPCVYDDIAVLHRRLNDDEKDMLIIVKKEGKWYVHTGYFGYSDADQSRWGSWSTSFIRTDADIYGPYDAIVMGIGYSKKADGTTMQTSLYTGVTRPAELTRSGIIEVQEGTTLMWVGDENKIGIKEIEGDYIATVHMPQFSYVAMIDGGGEIYAVDKGEAFIMPLNGKFKNKHFKLSNW